MMYTISENLLYMYIEQLYCAVIVLLIFPFFFSFAEKMAQNITEEIKRLHRRKQLTFNSHNFERMQDSESSGSEMGPDSPRRPDSPPSMVKNPEKALFTFKQVGICGSWECLFGLQKKLYRVPKLSSSIVSKRCRGSCWVCWIELKKRLFPFFTISFRLSFTQPFNFYTERFFYAIFANFTHH